MAGDGLWRRQHADGGVPLSLAARYLSDVLIGVDRPPAGVAAEQPDGWQILRIEIPVVAAGTNTPLVFDWLESHSHMPPRALFSSRDASLIVAGVGAAHVFSEGESDFIPELSLTTHERIRYVGGVRFDTSDPHAKTPGAEWGSFGRCYWILPRVELSVSGGSPPTSADSTSSATPSSNSWVNLASHEQKRPGLVSATLAVQLRWREHEAGSWAQERQSALSALAQLQPSLASKLPYLGALASRSEGITKEEFEAKVRSALKAFEEGDLRKVVLARRVLLKLTHEIDAVSLLRHVVGASHGKHYLFVLEPERGSAFVSLTPERLCKVQEADVWTEAVAGTWPIAEFEEMGEAGLLACSEKNSSEHQLVVDYIRELLDSVSNDVEISETHILKLRHLVHIKQSYHAVAKGVEKQYEPRGLTKFFCERVSPTPAVGGIPLTQAQNFLRDAESFDRGLYAAPCGLINARGSELTVALRSCLIRDGKTLHVYAGAGIVPGSNPEAEHAEISLKMLQFTNAFPEASEASVCVRGMDSLAALPNMNTLWASLLVEECVRSGVSSFVICAGSRSTPLVVAVARHPKTKVVVNHDERGAAFYAVGWAKAMGSPVAVIVTSGTAVANLLPGVVEASQSQVPLLLLTADRPAELRDTGANQTITQPGIFGVNVRWAKDMPCPCIDYPAHALLGDVDLALAHANGALSGNPGPVQLNMCFRENLAPDSGPVRGAPERTSEWQKSYIDTQHMHRWLARCEPRSRYAQPRRTITDPCLVSELVSLASSGDSRIVVLVGTMTSAREALEVEDVAERLGAAVFADITSGLRQRPGTVHYADQLLNCPLLGAELLQIDVVLHIGGPLCSARLNAFAKSAAPRLHIRVASAPVRYDQDHVVTHHMPCSLSALAEALVDAGLPRRVGPPPFWKRLSDAAEEVLATHLSAAGAFTEPFVAHAVSRLLCPGGHLQVSSSMPIRDLEFFAHPCSDASAAPNPAFANRGASGIDGVISTAAGFCKGRGAPSTLLIGDIASLHDLNALQQLSGADAPPLTVVVVNNGGGGIFNFLPIARHSDVLATFFNEPHSVDFEAACKAFGVPYTCCETACEFELAYANSQRCQIACVIEARVALSHEDNVAIHKEMGQAVASRARTELLSQVRLGWTQKGGAPVKPDLTPCDILLLHGWLGERADWASVSETLVQHGHNVLCVDLPGHGLSQVGVGKHPDAWEAAALFNLAITTESLAELLERLRIPRVVVAGYSLGGRVAMSLATTHPGRVFATVSLSAHPGLTSAGDRHQRIQQDSSLASRLVSISTEEFLKSWYAAPLWADLAKRRPGVYDAMVSRRSHMNKCLAALSLVGMSLGRQADCWALASKENFWYAHGALDQKFAQLGSSVARRSASNSAPGIDTPTCPQLLVLPGAGHAVVEECPDEVANFVVRICQDVSARATPICTPPDERVFYVRAASSERFEVPLKSPLVLSRGDPLQHRAGRLILLELGVRGVSDVAAGKGSFAGIGEVCPLPLFHQETLAQAEAQLDLVLQAWNSNPPTVPLSLLNLDGGMAQWLSKHCILPDSLLQSVRSGLEMALLHALSRAQGKVRAEVQAAKCNGLAASSDVGINALIAREEDVQSGLDGATIVKVKVGKHPVEDANRVNSLAVAMQKKNASSRLRLDANQAWTVDEAAKFLNHLSDSSVAMIDYLEEPVQCKKDGHIDLLKDWEKLAELTSCRVRFAVDETLTETTLCLDQLKETKAPIAAIVLKPALQGFEKTFRFGAWALKHGMKPVLSSAFESGVALCHFAILAANLSIRADGGFESHGLGTFTRLAEDTLDPPFADLVRSGGPCGWRVNVLSCQDALDRSVDDLIDARRSGS